MLARLTIGARIALALAVVALLLLVVGLTGARAASGAADRLDRLADVDLPGIELLDRLAGAQAAVARNLNALFLPGLASDRELRGAARTMLSAALEEIAGARRAFAQLPRDPETEGAWSEVERTIDAWLDRVRPALAAIEDHERLLDGGAPRDGAEARAAYARAWGAWLAQRQLLAPAQAAIQALGSRRRAAVEAGRSEGRAAVSSAGVALAGAIAAGLLLLAAVGWALARSLRRAVGALVGEASRLTAAIADGHAEARGDPECVERELRPVIEGMNRILDAFGAPLRVVTESLGRIARGDLPPRISESYRGDFEAVKASLNECLGALSALEEDAARLAAAAIDGRLGERADGARHAGVYRRIVEGFNGAIATLVGHLDAMPAPAMIIDREFRVRYLNAAALAVVGKPAEQVAGRRCSELFATTDCSTERCACARAMTSDRVASSETVARPRADLVLDIGYSGVPIRDRAGAIVGAFEVISDQTAVKGAMRQATKVAEFQSCQTEQVVAALEKLSRGDLSIDLAAASCDADTEAAAATFRAIGAAIERSVAAMNGLARDVGALVDAGVAGRLAFRADPSAHQGEFRKIVEGVNRTLDAVLAPVTEAARTLEQLAQRDLQARVVGTFQGEHARIKDSVNGTAQALEEALAQVAEAVEQVSSAATQIAASSQAVAAGASEQASSLEETGASIESVSSITRQAADSAQQANGLAQTARAAAADGAASVDRLQGAMAKIRASAEGTSQIIRDINDIAFQTNLLALNAAVEAARAGEAGRGFAVVAEEVRSLALRAKEAATKTEGLISESVRQAGEGEATGRQVAGKLGEIVAGIEKVTAIVSEIAASAKEQAAGIAQVNQAVAEMDKVTQQNAASAEESSSAASELSGQSEELAAMVGAFQIGRRGEGAGRVGAPRSRPLAAPARPARPATGGAGGRAAGRAAPRPRTAEELLPLEDGAATGF